MDHHIILAVLFVIGAAIKSLPPYSLNCAGGGVRLV
jgi:hypothetical protein